MPSVLSNTCNKCIIADSQSTGEIHSGAALPANAEKCGKELCSLQLVRINSITIIISSLDVVSLYSNIPTVEIVDETIELLDQHRQEEDMFSLTPAYVWICSAVDVRLGRLVF